jgi:hypothetical protein
MTKIRNQMMIVRGKYMKIKMLRKLFKDWKKGRSSGMGFVKTCKMNSRESFAAQI